MEAKQTASKGSFTDLALQILDLALKLDSQLASQGREPTTFESDTLQSLPVEINATREEFINKTQTAKRLALGADGILRELLFQFTDDMALRAIYDFRLAQHVPLNTPATFEEIAQASSLDSTIVERILRHAMYNHIFSEAPGQPSGRVVHTAASRLLVTNPDALAAVGMLAKDLAPISTRLNEAILHWRDLPASERDEPTQAATALVYGPGQTYFGLLKNDEARAARFAGAMQYFAEGTEEDIKYLLAGYPWDILDKQGAILVDVGGGTGGPARVLAAGTHHLQVVVQDLSGPVTKGAQTLPSTLTSRVVFEAHDFFEPQPRRGVDAFYLRWILHNWNDKNAVRILKALVPGMKHGTRVIINEYVLKDGPETRLTRKHDRNLDLLMLAVWNAKERTEAKWKEIIEAADSRLQFKGSRQIEGSILHIIEAVWEEPATKLVGK